MSRILLCIAALLGALFAPAAASAAPPRTVYFPSADGRTELVAYLYAPDGAGTHPAVVLLHGRGGPYSSNVNADCTTVARDAASACNASTLSRRHQMWGEYWAQHGYVALLVDSFGPRGRAHGYGRHSHDDPDRDAVNELTVRPLDAEGALAWLVSQPGVQAGRVMLQGWSNGGSTTLNVLQRQGTSTANRPRFRAALAFYPGCGDKALLARTLRLDVPVMLLLGSQDDEVSPITCREVARRSGGPGGAPQVQWYDGATHDFDDPGKTRQDVAANRDAQADALRRAAAFFDAVR